MRGCFLRSSSPAASSGDLAGDRQEGPDVRLDALEVHAAVAGNADDDDLAFAGGQGDGEDDVLERVGGSPGAAVGLARGTRTLAASTSVSMVGVSGVSRTSAAGALLKSMSAGTTVVTASTLAA